MGISNKNSQISVFLAEPGEDSIKECSSRRQKWSNGNEFLMSCIAMSVGLGNVWRFPYTAFNNGGGAFLIPYIIVLFVIGKPVYYMEMALGQFISRGPVKVWSVCPALKGLGYGQIFAAVLALTYYCFIMALTVFYFTQSFNSELPWSTCDPEWNNCFDSKKVDNGTIPEDFTGLKSSTELYLFKTVLHEKNTIDDGIGLPDWQLSLCLLISWIIIFLVIVRGVKSSGKAAYFLALFPYVVMLILLVRGVTLPGAMEGIRYFFQPRWEKLFTAEVWHNAVTQAFYSLTICFGSLIMYSSYNDFHHNAYRDTIIITTVDTFTSLLAGCTTFSILGNLKYESGVQDIKDVVSGGLALAFVSYPNAIAKFDVIPQFFSVVFFLMLFTLGIGGAVALSGAINTIICDRFTKLKYWKVALVTCTCGFLVGLVYITPGGLYIMTVIDTYGVNFTIFILGTLEIVAVAWIYGVDNFCNDVEFMVGKKVGLFWRLCWGFITPVSMIVILIYSLCIMEPEKYDGKYLSTSTYVAGWGLFSFGMLQIPVWAIFALCKNSDKSYKQMIKSAFQPTEEWQPDNSKVCMQWNEFRENRKREISPIEIPSEKFIRVFINGRRKRTTGTEFSAMLDMQGISTSSV